jgi:predicted transcriptional regulator
MKVASENCSLHSEPSVAAVLTCISHPKILLLFKAVGLSDIDHSSKILITKLGLSRMQYYSSMEKLMQIGLVTRISGKHSLTSLGRVIFSCILKIEMSIKYYWKLKAIDSITMAADVKGLPTEQYDMIVDKLIDNDEIKTVLVSTNKTSVSEPTQSLVHRTLTST